MNRFAARTEQHEQDDGRHASARRHPARGGVSLLGVALLVSCGALVGGDATVGGETHFMLTCQDDCGPGLSCIEGVCTRGCEPGYSSCSELASGASCESVAPEAADRVGFSGTCDVRCENDGACASLAGGHTCRAGVCRAEPTAETPVGTNPTALVHAVAPDTCESGLRWMGGDTPSAEMLPGSDCVGCHRATGAPSLLFGGTVYANFRDPGTFNDCFGLEGVEVIVEDAEGRQHRSVTNRAGNFYVVGDESDLVLPYTAELRWNLDGEAVRTLMFTTPEYGGCARCHGVEGRLPSEYFVNPELVLPTADIFTPGLRASER